MQFTVFVDGKKTREIVTAGAAADFALATNGALNHDSVVAQLKAQGTLVVSANPRIHLVKTGGGHRINALYPEPTRTPRRHIKW